MCPGTTTDAAAVEETAVRSRINPRTVIFAVVILVVGVILVVSTIARGDVGVLKVDDTGVSKVLTAAEADASASFPLTLLEGGDVVHESDHIFQSVSGFQGIGKVFIAADGATISVEYESALISEEQIREALVAAGYTQSTSGTAPAQ